MGMDPPNIGVDAVSTDETQLLLRYGLFPFS